MLPMDAKVELNMQELSLARAFTHRLDEIQWIPDAIHNSIHELIKAQNMEPKDGFATFYKILIGKTRGPRLGYFLSNMAMETVRERLAFVVGT